MLSVLEKMSFVFVDLTQNNMLFGGICLNPGSFGSFTECVIQTLVDAAVKHREHHLRL